MKTAVIVVLGLLAAGLFITWRAIRHAPPGRETEEHGFEDLSGS